MSSRKKASSISSARRCHWASNEWNIPYHDSEWGVPVHDDRLLFEFYWLDDLLCVHAGGRNGKRPRDHLFPLQGVVARNNYFVLERQQGSSGTDTRRRFACGARAPC